MKIVCDHLVTKENVKKYYNIYCQNLDYWQKKLYIYEKVGRYANDPSLESVIKNIDENQAYISFIESWCPAEVLSGEGQR